MAKRIRTKHVTIKTYPYRHEAEPDKTYLESRGIKVMFQDATVSGQAPGRLFGGQGVRLMVPKSQADQARELLKELLEKARKTTEAKPDEKAKEKEG